MEHLTSKMGIAGLQFKPHFSIPLCGITIIYLLFGKSPVFSLIERLLILAGDGRHGFRDQYLIRLNEDQAMENKESIRNGDFYNKRFKTPRRGSL